MSEHRPEIIQESPVSSYLGVPTFVVQFTAIIAAVSAGMLALLVAPKSMAQGGWLEEAVVGIIVATIWMAIGTALSRSHPITCALLLLVGAAISRFLAFGIMAGVSLYYGITTYIPATLMGGLVWTMIAHRHQRSVRWPLFFTTVLIAVQLSRVLVFGMPGERRSMQVGNASINVSVVSPATPGGPTYIWQTQGSAVGLRPDSVTASIDLDNSGSTPHQLVRVADRAERAAACQSLEASTRERVRAEVAAGTVPALVAALPIRSRDCEAGIMWRVAGWAPSP